MKKIVFLHPSHWQQAMGGAELQISFLAKYLSKLDFEIHFIYEDKGSRIENREGFILHPMTKINHKNNIGKLWFLYYYKIKKLLNNIQPDIIYTRTFKSWSGIASKYAKKNKVIHLWALACDNDLRQRVNAKSVRKPFNIIELEINRNAFKNASNILTQNNVQTHELLKRYKRNGIKVLQMGSLVDSSDTIKPKNDINIVWIANLKPAKRPEIFLNLVDELSTYPNCKFSMIGRPADKYQLTIDKLSKKVKNFKFLGELSNKKVNELLCQSHILVNTSYVEGFSNTFIQAWMRRVVVLTMSSNPDEILTNQKIGYVCPRTADLKEKIKLLINNNDLRKSMANKAFSYAREYHSIEKNMKKILQFLE